MAMPAIDSPEGADAASAWRDRLLVDRLVRAIEVELDLVGRSRIEVLGLDRDWWDGRGHDACLLVREVGTRRRHRVVETCGDTVVVPARPRRARRAIAERLDPSTGASAAIPGQRSGHLTVDATHDAVRCHTMGCGAMRDLDLRRSCPRCGR